MLHQRKSSIGLVPKWGTRIKPGTRVATTQNSVSRTFKRDGAYGTDPVLSDGAASYTPSISERRGAATTFLHSGIKNADAQTSAAGSVSGTRVYDAFGAELSSTGSWQGAFGYAGGFGYQEDANGFKLLGHRYYDPSTGRFLTRDPAKDGRNWYAYCENDPINWSDERGLFAVQIGAGGQAIIGLVTVSLTADIVIADDGWGVSITPGFGWGVGAYIGGDYTLALTRI
jgi:RHS repeat-associated protein